MRDTFAELILKFNRKKLRDTVADINRTAVHSPPLFILHIHDEASFRVRTHLNFNSADVDMTGCNVVNRSALSKVQNHHVTLSMHSGFSTGAVSG